MYKLADTPVLLKSEIDHLVAYLAPRWDNIPSPAELFYDIADLATQDAPYWFDQYAVGDALHAREQAREALLTQYRGADIEAVGPYYDAPYRLLGAWSRGLARLRDSAMNLHGSWDYSRNTERAYRTLAAKYPTLKNARPKGWDALAKGYSDFDGMEAYCETQARADREAFQGFDSASAGAPGVHGRTALPYVMYDEKCQGRLAPTTLVSAVYAHVLRLNEHNNTLRFIAALQELDVGEATPDLVFKRPVLASAYPLVAALLAITEDTKEAYTAADFEQARERHRAFEALSEDEKAARRAESAQEIHDMMSSLMSGNEDREYEKTRKTEEARGTAVLKAALTTAGA